MHVLVFFSLTFFTNFDLMYILDSFFSILDTLKTFYIVFNEWFYILLQRQAITGYQHIVDVKGLLD